MAFMKLDNSQKRSREREKLFDNNPKLTYAKREIHTMLTIWISLRLAYLIGYIVFMVSRGGGFSDVIGEILIFCMVGFFAIAIALGLRLGIVISAIEGLYTVASVLLTADFAQSFVANDFFLSMVYLAALLIALYQCVFTTLLLVRKKYRDYYTAIKELNAKYRQ